MSTIFSLFFQKVCAAAALPLFPCFLRYNRLIFPGRAAKILPEQTAEIFCIMKSGFFAHFRYGIQMALEQLGGILQTQIVYILIGRNRIYFLEQLSEIGFRKRTHIGKLRYRDPFAPEMGMNIPDGFFDPVIVIDRIYRAVKQLAIQIVQQLIKQGCTFIFIALLFFFPFIIHGYDRFLNGIIAFRRHRFHIVFGAVTVIYEVYRNDRFAVCRLAVPQGMRQIQDVPSFHGQRLGIRFELSTTGQANTDAVVITVMASIAPGLPAADFKNAEKL